MARCLAAVRGQGGNRKPQLSECSESERVRISAQRPFTGEARPEGILTSNKGGRGSVQVFRRVAARRSAQRSSETFARESQDKCSDQAQPGRSLLVGWPLAGGGQAQRGGVAARRPQEASGARSTIGAKALGMEARRLDATHDSPARRERARG
jgi:hypothetical protein